MDKVILYSLSRGFVRQSGGSVAPDIVQSPSGIPVVLGRDGKWFGSFSGDSERKMTRFSSQETAEAWLESICKPATTGGALH